MASSFLLKEYDAETTQVFHELIQESLRILLPVTAMLTWGWDVYVFLFVDHQFYRALGVLILTLAIAWASYRLSEKHLHVAVGLYLAGLITTVTIIGLISQGSAALYLYMLVVLITAMLTSPLVAGGVALANAGLVWAISQRGHTAQLADVALPIIMITLAALTAWLSSRRLFTALAWALSMTQEAQKNAGEAQKHRAEVQRVLKSLDEAYVRLERANEALLFAQEAAEKAYRFKAEFVANVSHELRTPLNLIVGFSEMMATAPESYGDVPLPSEYRGDVMATYRSARHLSDLIDDVLDLSRIEAGRMPLIKETTDLGEVVREATDMVRGLVEARGLCLELDIPDDLPKLHLDRTRIRQVLLNLLTNATRFTDQGGIRVQIRAEDQEATVVVQDSGRGIAPDKLTQAFEAFSQLEDSQAREGSGMGLAVSKRFIELHGGRMWIKSQEGLGTTVSFALPIPRDGKEIRLSHLEAGTPLQSHTGNPSVLVLHDDPRTLSLLRRYVDGYQFSLADTVDKVREMIYETLPVAVIMDATWSERWGVNGAELGLPPCTPLITCPLPSMRRLGLLLGAADYLPKPVTREDLQDAFSRLPEPPQTVLVVDDNPHVVRLLARMLRASNSSLRVLEAFGGREGLEIARSERPDVILLDLLMPEMSGYDFLENAAGDERMAKTRIIVVSVRSVEQESPPIMGELRLGRAAGFSLTELLQTLRATLSATTRSVTMAPASAATLPAAQPA